MLESKPSTIESRMEQKCRPTKNSHSSLGQWTSPKGVQPSELVVLMHSSIDQVKALASSPQVSTRFDGRCMIAWLKVLTSQDCGSGKVCDKREDKRESARGQPGRDRVVSSAHPRAPARLRVGGVEWRRLFGSRRLGDPAHSSEASVLGQAQ